MKVALFAEGKKKQRQKQRGRQKRRQIVLYLKTGKQNVAESLSMI